MCSPPGPQWLIRCNGEVLKGAGTGVRVGHGVRSGRGAQRGVLGLLVCRRCVTCHNMTLSHPVHAT